MHLSGDNTEEEKKKKKIKEEEKILLILIEVDKGEGRGDLDTKKSLWWILLSLPKWIRGILIHGAALE